MNNKPRTLLPLLLSGLLFLLMVVITIAPPGLYLASSEQFLSALMRFADVHAPQPINQTLSSTQLIVLLLTSYLPVSLLVFTFWQGIKVMQFIRARGLLDQRLALSIKRIAVSLLIFSVVLPVTRFLIPWVVYWPLDYYQITIQIGDLCFLLISCLLYVTFRSMLEGIQAQEENKEFI